MGLLGILVALGALSWIHFTEMRATARLTRFVIPQPEGVSYAETSPPFVSPDGRTVGFIGLNARGQRAIWLRRMGSLEASPLAGTEGVVGSAGLAGLVDLAVDWPPSLAALTTSRTKAAKGSYRPRQTRGRILS